MIRRLSSALAFAALAACGLPAAADFAFAVSPPRFELAARPGERLRQVIEVTNTSARASALLVKTADWEMRDDESVVFHDELQADSCRPWVAIERRELLVGARQSWRFRFEVTPPADQAPRECRFAILLEGKEPSFAGAAQALPIAARVAVIVYVSVGGVAPELALTGARVETRNGRPTALLQVRNAGTAHGRLDGFLTARDAQGRSFDATPANSPILPGQSRWVALSLTRPGDADAAADAAFPIAVQGKLEWGKGRSTAVDQRFER